jgi:hypothetical protein
MISLIFYSNSILKVNRNKNPILSISWSTLLFTLGTRPVFFWRPPLGSLDNVFKSSLSNTHPGRPCSPTSNSSPSRSGRAHCWDFQPHKLIRFQCCHVLLLHQPCFKFDDERSILLVNHSSSHLSQNSVVLIFLLTCVSMLSCSPFAPALF